MRFSIAFSSKSAAFLKKIRENETKNRILEEIEKLGGDALPRSHKKIAGEKSVYRIRVGDYRILYEIYWDKNEILIVKIGHRQNVYE